jgi:hypothetical protein
LLYHLFVQLEAANKPNRQQKIEQLNSRLQHELENDKWLLADT